MSIDLVKRLESTRHTLRRFAIWHFARWLFVPAFTVTAMFGAASMLLGVLPRELEYDSYPVTATVGIVLLSVLLAIVLIRVINQASASVVIAISSGLFIGTALVWGFVIMILGDDAILGACAVSVGVPFFLSILTYNLRIHRSNWFADLSDHERDAIDEAARRF